MIAAVLVIFTALTLVSVPIAFATGIAVAGALAFFSPFPVTVMFQKMVTGIDNYTLVAIPLFVLTGNLMNAGGITDRIFAFVRACLGHRRGGLAHANVGASVLFAGMSGSAVADAAGMGAVEIKAMRDQGYKADFAAAVTAASSVIGPIIPPSIPFVIYGALAEVSVGQLFVAGIVPGFLVALCLSGMISWSGRDGRYPSEPRVPWRSRFSAFARAALSLATPAIILAGMIGGIFTATEAGAVASAWALLLSLVVYRTLRLRDLPTVLVETMLTTAIVTFIISNVSVLQWILAVTHSGDAFVSAVTSMTDNRLLVLLIINLCLLLMGALMEAGAVLIIMTPILLPLAVSVGVDPVHFGVIMVLNLMIGVATPPVGMSLFVTAHVAGISLERMIRAILPFLVPLFVALAVVTYWPGFVLFLPHLIYR